MQRHLISLSLSLLLLLITGCGGSGGPERNDLSIRKVKVVATTSLVADLAQNIGGERVAVTALMGPGVDPHLFKASERDVIRMAEADIIFFNGLHLEGAMAEVLERMQGRKKTVAIAGSLDPNLLISPEGSKGVYDPHIWFDVSLWIKAGSVVQKALVNLDSVNAPKYRATAAEYLARLDSLHDYVTEQANLIPDTQRVLITAHDAFNYFGRAYGFKVHGLQGISTATEAGTADVQNLAKFIASKKIPAVFIESSVPRRSVEAVQAAVATKGFKVEIGGELFSDALGNPDTPEGEYIGMVKHNINTIVSGLWGE